MGKWYDQGSERQDFIFSLSNIFYKYKLIMKRKKPREVRPAFRATFFLETSASFRKKTDMLSRQFKSFTG